MSFLKELTDKGATIAWSNVAAHPSLIALGTKDSGGGSGFDDYGGELELHKLDFSQDTDGGGAGTLLGKVKTSTRFATLAWSEMATKQAEYPYGLIAGGMSDGTVNVWDPAKLVASHPQPQVASVNRHTGPVTGLHFNPHKSSSYLLASGGADSEVFIISLDRPDAPDVFVPGPKPNTSRHTAEVTKVAWNSQVSHIMATAAQNGSCIVWDLKQKKPWCELKDPNRAPVTDVAWNPEQGQHLVTASGDDNNPVLKLWDLRSSTTLPLATLAGHTEGVLSVAWCPYDASLLMSCAKDNRTLLWDLFSLKPVYELPPGAGAAVQGQEQTQMFGGYGKTAQRRYQVSWSPHIPAVVGTCSFDRKVQLFTMNGASTSNGRAPKWHRRPAGASFAFGGRLVSYSSSGDGASTQCQQDPAATSTVVKISSVKEDAAFVAASRRFEEAMASQSFKGFCQEKEASTTSAHERRVWQFMQVIFEKNARNQLLAHLGFDGDTVARQAAEFVATLASPRSQQNGSTAGKSPPPQLPLGDDDAGDSGTGGDSLLDDDLNDSAAGPPGTSELAEVMDAIDLGGVKEHKMDGLFSVSTPSPPSYGMGGGGFGKKGMSNSQPLSKAAEAVIKRSLLVGNFEAAVQCCMSTGNMADALLLASCGGAELWAKTQAQYFARESHRRPFLRIVSAIIKSELGVLVEASDLSQWEETLAILSTYAKQQEFPALCEALASRLETEAGDRKSANLCYMCAVKVPKTVEMWADELRAANAAINGGTDTKALQEFVEKVSVFTQEPNDPPGEEVAAFFAEYAGILASEGETETALKYIRGQDAKGAILMDRLYQSTSHPAGTSAPPSPFELVRIGVSPQSVLGGGGGTGAAQGGLRVGANGASASRASAVAGNGGVVNQRAAAAPAGVGGDPPLPPSWTQMTDPQRGLPYYCNTATGETQWERPPPPPQPRAVPTPRASTKLHPAQPSYSRSPAVATATPAFGTTAATSSSSAMSPMKQPVYGGGPTTPRAFAGQTGGSSPQQRQPMVSAPYGNSMNVGGSGGSGSGAHLSPYQVARIARGGGAPGGGHGGFAAGGGGMGAGTGGSAGVMPGGGGAQPGLAGVAVSPARSLQGMGEGDPRARNAYGMNQPVAPSSVTPSPAIAPVAAVARAPSPPPPSDAESQAVVSAMNGMLGALSEIPLSPPEKKMLGDVTKSVGVLFSKMGHGQVEQEVLDKVRQLVEHLQARDMKAANAIQQGLANSAWQNHKDWLKGLKYLTTLVSRRL